MNLGLDLGERLIYATSSTGTIINLNSLSSICQV